MHLGETKSTIPTTTGSSRVAPVGPVLSAVTLQFSRIIMRVLQNAIVMPEFTGHISNNQHDVTIDVST
jgi:hypothetical protein